MEQPDDINLDDAKARLSAEDLKALQQLLAPQTTLDALYADFAKEELGAGAIGRDPVEAGKAHLRNLHGSVEGFVCGSATVRELVEDKTANTADMIALGAVIAALIDQSPARIVNTTLVAALIVRVGVRKFCAKKWSA